MHSHTIFIESTETIRNSNYHDFVTFFHIIDTAFFQRVNQSIEDLFVDIGYLHGIISNLSYLCTQMNQWHFKAFRQFDLFAWEIFFQVFSFKISVFLKYTIISIRHIISS